MMRIGQRRLSERRPLDFYKGLTIATIVAFGILSLGAAPIYEPPPPRCPGRRLQARIRAWPA